MHPFGYYFLGRREASKLICLRKGFEKLLSQIMSLRNNLSKRYTARVTREIPSLRLKYLVPTNMYTFLNKARESFKRIRQILTPVLEYSKRRFLEIIILVVSILGILISWKSFSLQQQENLPFFHYNYGDGVFQVDGGSRVEVTKVEWLFPSRHFSERGQWELRRVGGHPTVLGFFEIRDYIAYEVIDGHTPHTIIEDHVLCNLYLFEGAGIPALVSVTYDKNGAQELTNSDFVWITRLDTSIPKVIVQPGGRHVADKKIKGLFDGIMPWYTSTINSIKEHPGICSDIIWNQPLEGYSNSNIPQSSEEGH